MKPIELNLEKFNELIAADKPVLVDFWAPWCVYCRRIAPAYEKIAQEYGEKVVVAKVNIDDYPQIANRENIEVIPTLILYKDGKAQGFVVAPESKGKIGEFIEQYL